MNTEQNYVGRGNHASPTEQTAEKATQAANSEAKLLPSLSTSRQESIEENLIDSSMQILHIKLWYGDGRQREMNLTSPSIQAGEDIELQYLYLRMYLRKVAPMWNIKAYQGSVIYDDPIRGLRPVATFEKIDCLTVPPFKPGQYCDGN